jgi:predicted nucleic acid-binding protein
LVVVDTSAWVELFRNTGSPVALRLEGLLRARAEIAVTEMIVFELLAGTRGEVELQALRARLAALPMLVLAGLADFEAAAALYRACRRGGETVRVLADCLVAVPVIRAGATLLAADRDFEALARHSPLRLEPVAA